MPGEKFVQNIASAVQDPTPELSSECSVFTPSPSSEGLLIGRLKKRMAADVLKHNSYIV